MGDLPSWVDFDDPDGMGKRWLLMSRKGRPRVDFLIREMNIECYAYQPPMEPKLYCVIFPTVAALNEFRELCRQKKIDLPTLDRIDVWKH